MQEAVADASEGLSKADADDLERLRALEARLTKFLTAVGNKHYIPVLLNDDYRTWHSLVDVTKKVIHGAAQDRHWWE